MPRPPGRGSPDIGLDDDEDVVTLSSKKSPLAGMGVAQKVATIVLGVLALIALVAVLAHGGGRSESKPSAGFTPASYGSSQGSGGSSSSTHRHSSHGSSPRSSAAVGSAGRDGLATVSVSDLPAEAASTLKLIDAGGPFPYSRDGIVFSNREGALPRQARGWYHEYTVKTPGERDRGTRRLIEGKDGTIYYTGDHYVTFRRVLR